MTVQTTAETTLEDLANLINNDADNPGVTASILKYDDGAGGVYHLVLSGRNSGSDYQITVDTSSAEVQTANTILQSEADSATEKTKIHELDDFSGQSIDFANMSQVTISGSRHDGTAVNSVMSLTAESTLEDLIAEIEDAFGDTVKVTFDDGEFEVIDKTTGSSLMSVQLDFETGSQTASLSFSQSTQGGAVLADIASLDASTFIETQSAQDSLIKVDNYPPGTDDWISRSSNTVDDVIEGVTLHLNGTTENATTPGTYDTIEVNLTRDTEQLVEKITAMIESYNEVIEFINEKSSYNEEEKKSGILSSEYSLTNIRSLIKNPLVTNATGFTSSDSFMNPSDIGIEVDAEGKLSLDQSVFDEAIVDDYLGVLSLIGAQKTGSTSGTGAAYVRYYGSSRHTEAGTYNAQVTVSGGVITSAKIKTSDEDWADARDAVIDGNYIYGNQEVDSDFRPINPEYDLQLAVDTSTDGTYEVTLNIREGFAGNLYNTVDDMVDFSSGRVTIVQDNVAERIRNIENRIDSELNRLDSVESRLVARFARLEKMLAMIQQQFSGLTML
jgi:flagellar capping protein FliD